MIRKVREKDWKWCIDLATKVYPPETFDPVDAEIWLGKITNNPEFGLFRGDECFAFATVMRKSVFIRQIFGSLILIASTGKAGLEPVKLLREVMKWARGCGAEYLGFDSVFGANLAPFARRIGAEPCGPAYRVKL